MGEIWTTGITVKHSKDGWIAWCKWQSGKFANSGCMEGEIATRYYESTITQAIDYVLEFMHRMGIQRSDEVEELNDLLGFALYYDEDDEASLSKELQQILKDEAKKRNWKCYVE